MTLSECLFFSMSSTESPPMFPGLPAMSGESGFDVPSPPASPTAQTNGMHLPLLAPAAVPLELMTHMPPSGSEPASFPHGWNTPASLFSPPAPSGLHPGLSPPVLAPGCLPAGLVPGMPAPVLNPTAVGLPSDTSPSPPSSRSSSAPGRRGDPGPSRDPERMRRGDHRLGRDRARRGDHRVSAAFVRDPRRALSPAPADSCDVSLSSAEF